jgi:plastocyanin
MNHSVEQPARRAVMGLMLAAASTAAVRIAAAGAAAAIPTGWASKAQAAAPAEVSISNFSFQPGLLAVKAGAKVTWTNRDTTPHTITSTDKRFVSSSGLDTNDQYSYVFDKPGTYDYFCSLHPMMVGKVTVQPAG